MVYAEEPQVIRTVYRPQGECARLFDESLGQYDEVLVEGPAGTGKTLAMCMMIHRVCRKYPKSKIVLMRKTRDSMSTSVLETLEEQVFEHDGYMADVYQRRDRTQRDHYEYPNKSRIILAGAADVERLKSSERSIVYINEATELTEDDWSIITTRLRPSGTRRNPYSTIFADCNPDRYDHWLNQHFPPLDVHEDEQEKLDDFGMPPPPPIKKLRLCTKLTDNPMLWDAERQEWSIEGRRYAAKLSALPGAGRDRYYGGLWVSESGLVYPEFTQKHIIEKAGLPPIVRYFMGADWGYEDAGVLQVWGQDIQGRMYHVAEQYHIGETPDWWANKAVEFYHEFDPVAIVCDPSRPDMIDMFNKFIGKLRNRPMRPIAVKANNAEWEGVMLVKDYLKQNKLFYVRDALRHRDRKITDKSKGRPTCTIKEFGNFTWEKDQDGKPRKERPERSCHSDGLDVTRYILMHVYDKKAKGGDFTHKYEPGTFGHYARKRGWRFAS